MTAPELAAPASEAPHRLIDGATFGPGAVIEDEVFVGHGVVFVNDRRPRAADPSGELQGDEGWGLLETVVERGAGIGSGATQARPWSATPARPLPTARPSSAPVLQ